MTIIDQFAKLSDEYGPLIVVLAVICGIVYMIVKNNIDNKKAKLNASLKLVEEKNKATIESEKEAAKLQAEEKRQKREDERYEKLVKGIAELTSKIAGTVVHTPEEQDEDVDVNLIIQNELDELVNKHNADRAYYFRYHNGGVDVLGRGMLKMSMAVESCSYQNTIMMQWQRTPRSMFPVLYEKLAKDGDYYIPEVHEIAISDVRTYSVLMERATCSAFFKAVKRSDGLIAGFVGVEFSHNDINIEEVKKDISRKADRITGVLMCTEEH